jgi:hypothetical protein
MQTRFVGSALSAPRSPPDRSGLATQAIDSDIMARQPCRGEARCARSDTRMPFDIHIHAMMATGSVEKRIPMASAPGVSRPWAGRGDLRSGRRAPPIGPPPHKKRSDRDRRDDFVGRRPSAGVLKTQARARPRHPLQNDSPREF